MPSIPGVTQVRDDEKSGLDSSETLGKAVEAPCAENRRRPVEAEFIARGIHSRDEARRTGQYVDAHVVLERLRRNLDEALARTTNNRE